MCEYEVTLEEELYGTSPRILTDRDEMRKHEIMKYDGL